MDYNCGKECGGCSGGSGAYKLPREQDTGYSVVGMGNEDDEEEKRRRGQF